MRRILMLLPLLVCGGCSDFQNITCTLDSHGIHCDQGSMAQDSFSSNRGAEDEKPVTTFQKSLQRFGEPSPWS